MLKLCITFDYELFFNDTNSTEKAALIAPTAKLVQALDEMNVKGTFFVDVSAILRYKELGMNEFPKLAEEQVRLLYSRGHDVGLHIHPHWYTSTFTNGWNHDNSHYRIHSFKFSDTKKRNVKSANEIVSESVDYLNNLLQVVDEKYRCISFRAGGFCLQPEQEYLQALLEKGIKVDSSVCKGIFKDSGIHYYSFMHMPSQANWWVNPDQGLNVPIEIDKSKTIYEIPIGSYGKKPSKWMLSKAYPKLKQPPRKGAHTPNSMHAQNIFKKYLGYFKNIWSQSLIFTLDGYHYRVLLRFVDEFLKNHPDEGDYYISLICHPKFSNKVLVKNMESFIDSIHKDYRGRVKFSTISEAYNQELTEL